MGYHTLETRQRVIEHYLEGTVTQEEACEAFSVSLSSFKRWLTRHRRGEVPHVITEGKGRPRRVDEAGEKFIQQLVESNPSITLAEISKAYYKKKKVEVGRSVLSRILQSFNLRHKKLSIQASEKNNEAVKKKDERT